MLASKNDLIARQSIKEKEYCLDYEKRTASPRQSRRASAPEVAAVTAARKPGFGATVIPCQREMLRLQTTNWSTRMSADIVQQSYEKETTYVNISANTAAHDFASGSRWPD
jgi:hypothetical protein